MEIQAVFMLSFKEQNKYVQHFDFKTTALYIHKIGLRVVDTSLITVFS